MADLMAADLDLDLYARLLAPFVEVGPAGALPAHLGSLESLAGIGFSRFVASVQAGRDDDAERALLGLAAQVELELEDAREIEYDALADDLEAVE